MLTVRIYFIFAAEIAKALKDFAGAFQGVDEEAVKLLILQKFRSVVAFEDLGDPETIYECTHTALLDANVLIPMNDRDFKKALRTFSETVGQTVRDAIACLLAPMRPRFESRKRDTDSISEVTIPTVAGGAPNNGVVASGMRTVSGLIADVAAVGVDVAVEASNSNDTSAMTSTSPQNSTMQSVDVTQNDTVNEGGSPDDSTLPGGDDLHIEIPRTIPGGVSLAAHGDVQEDSTDDSNPEDVSPVVEDGTFDGNPGIECGTDGNPEMLSGAGGTTETGTIRNPGHDAGTLTETGPETGLLRWICCWHRRPHPANQTSQEPPENSGSNEREVTGQQGGRGSAQLREVDASVQSDDSPTGLGAGPV